MLRFFALQVTLMSVTIIISEITLFLKLNLSIIGMIVDACSNSIFMLNIIVVSCLIFLFYACLYGVFNLKISGVYGMYKNNQTDSTSLLFVSGFMCRIGFPLLINFVQFLKLKRKTIIEEIVGSTELDPFFGVNFFMIYPASLFILILLNLLGWYDNVLRLLGASTEMLSYKTTDEKIKEGQQILNKCKIKFILSTFRF